MYVVQLSRDAHIAERPCVLYACLDDSACITRGNNTLVRSFRLQGAWGIEKEMERRIGSTEKILVLS